MLLDGLKPIYNQPIWKNSEKNDFIAFLPDLCRPDFASRRPCFASRKICCYTRKISIVLFSYFGRNFQTVTRNFARFEALESLLNSLSNNEWISIKLMTFISLNLSLIRWRVAQNRAFEVVSSTLYCSCSKYTSIPYKMNEKLLIGTQIH